MILASNEKWMLTYEPEKVFQYTLWFSTNSMFKQAVWHGSTLQSKILRKFLTAAEIRKAKAKRDAEKKVSKRFAI